MIHSKVFLRSSQRSCLPRYVKSTLILSLVFLFTLRAKSLSLSLSYSTFSLTHAPSESWTQVTISTSFYYLDEFNARIKLLITRLAFLQINNRWVDVYTSRPVFLI